MKKYESGQSLIEILLALAIVVVIITGITFAVTSSVKNSTFSKNENLASSYAQEGMEIIRAIRDKSWNTFNTYNNGAGTSYSLAENSTSLVGPSPDNCPPSCAPNLGIFSRRVKIQRNASDCTAAANNAKVTVQVRWGDNACPGNNPFCHQVELVSCFSNFNFAPAP